MKGSIIPGGAKDASASILRALNGAPKCPAVGVRSMVYDCDLFYSSGGAIFIHPPAGTGFPNPPFGLPFGKWRLLVTSNILQPLPTILKFAMAQSTDVGGRFMVNTGGWDKILLKGNDPTDQRSHVAGVNGPTSGWRLLTIGFAEFLGPDLFPVFQLDMNAAGQFSTATILPEQSESCGYQFFPYVFTDLFSSSQKATQPSWSSSCNGFGQFEGWVLSGPSLSSLHPNNTKIGTLQFRFDRITNIPLFTWAISPPRNVTFSNRTFFNPALTPTWDWNFGDGSGHSSQQSPSHTYPSSGIYHVTLTSTDPTGTKTFDQYVTLTLKANFSYTTFNQPASIRIFPHDLSIGATTWDWDWGDGSAHDHIQNPAVHDFPKGQTFVVKLTVGDGTGKTDSLSQTIIT